MKTVWKVAKIVLINVVILIALFALLEGGASLLFVANEVRLTPARAEQSYSKYDEMLGWVSQPNVNLPNLYGQGVYLGTNAQAFRNDRDISRAVPAGKTRIICSGDSFTLGFGVNNDQTWCQRLAALDRRLETVNMGQGGYGLDQAYLWYLRAGLPLDHQVHLLAFITDDFLRMRSDRFSRLRETGARHPQRFRRRDESTRAQDAVDVAVSRGEGSRDREPEHRPPLPKGLQPSRRISPDSPASRAYTTSISGE